MVFKIYNGSHKYGYGRKCYRIVKLQEVQIIPETKEIIDNSILEELLNRVRLLELDNSFMKHQLRHKITTIKNLDAKLNWNIKPEVIQKRDEYKIEFNIVIKELKLILNDGKPILKKDFRFSDEELGIKDIENRVQVENINYYDVLKPINPIEEPVNPPIMVEV